MLLQASARRRFGNSGDVCTAEAAFALLEDSSSSIRLFIHEERASTEPKAKRFAEDSPLRLPPNQIRRKQQPLASRRQIIAPLSTYPFNDRPRLE